jgi:hypothetical protein
MEKRSRPLSKDTKEIMKKFVLQKIPSYVMSIQAAGKMRGRKALARQ